MWIFPVLLVAVAVNLGTEAVDPSACQKAIQYMLITACGATKRNSEMMHKLRVMDDAELDERYREMLRMNMIKGLEREYNEEERMNFGGNALDKSCEANKEDPLLFHRFRRDLFGLGMSKDRNYAESIGQDRRGSFHFISRLPTLDEGRSPLPGLLKAKCCGGPYLCTLDDFKGFCG